MAEMAALLVPCEKSGKASARRTRKADHCFADSARAMKLIAEAECSGARLASACAEDRLSLLSRVNSRLRVAAILVDRCGIPLFTSASLRFHVRYWILTMLSRDVNQVVGRASISRLWASFGVAACFWTEAGLLRAIDRDGHAPASIT